MADQSKDMDDSRKHGRRGGLSMSGPVIPASASISPDVNAIRVSRYLTMTLLNSLSASGPC